MEIVLQVIFVCAVLLIAWQDFISREISVWLFPVVALTIAFMHEGTFFHWISGTAENLLFLAVQLSVLWLYSYIRFGKRHFFKKTFGAGDVFMLVIVSCVFNLPGFIVFITGSCAVSLIFTLLWNSLHNNTVSEIPYAGIAACCLAACWIFDIHPEESLKFMQ